MRVSRSIGLLALGCVAAACSSGSSAAAPRVCTLIGAQSQVNFDLSNASIVRGDVVRVCIDGRCHTLSRTEVRDKLVNFADASLRTNPVTVTTTVRSDSGHLVTSAQGTVHAVKRQPNGPGCDPTVWQATVHVDGTHLTQTMES